MSSRIWGIKMYWDKGSLFLRHSEFLLYYFCVVARRNKILALFLLLLYLLAFGFQSTTVRGQQSISRIHSSSPSHHHDDFHDKHHDHHFHVGIFHFFGHLIEKIGQLKDLNTDHVYLLIETIKKDLGTKDLKLSKYFFTQNEGVFAVDSESLTDPPYYQIPYLQKLTRSTSPLRAPPSQV